MAQELGTGFVTIMPSTRGMSKEIEDALGGAVDSSLNKAEGRFRGFFGKVAAAGAAVLAAVGLGKLVKSTVGAGLKFNALEQSSRAAFTTILGSGAAATEMMNKLDAFTQLSPFDKSTFITGTQQLLGFGVAADRVIPTLNAVQDAVAAIGGSDNEISSITYALAQVKGQGKLTGDTLNQLGQYGINAADIIAKQMGLTSDQIRAMASKPGGIPADKVFDLLVNGLEDKFGGAAAGVKKTWGGITQSIGARLRNIGAALVEPFVSAKGGGYAVVWAGQLADMISAIGKSTVFHGLTVALDQFGKAASPIISKVFARITDFFNHPEQLKSFSATIHKVTDAVKTFSPLLFVINALKPVLPALALAFQGVGKSLQIAFVQLGPVATRLLADLAVVIGALAPVLGPVANLIARVLSEGLANLIPPLVTLATTLLPVFVQMLETLLPALVPLLPAIADLAVNVMPILVAILQSSSWWITNVTIPALLWLTQTIADNIPMVLAVVGALVAWKVVTEGISFVQLIAGLAASTAAWTSTTAAMLVSKAQTLILMGMYAKDFVVSVGATIAAVVASTGAWIANIAAQVGAKVVILAGAAALGVATAAQWLFNAALSANPIGIVVTAIAALVAGLVWFFTQTEVGKKAWGEFTRFLGEAWNNWVNLVKGGANMVIDLINGIIGAINTVAGGLKIITGGAIDIHVGKIPHLAEGGIIKARPGGILANIGEGKYDEMVLPLKPRVLDAFAGSGSGHLPPIYIQNPFTGEYLLAQVDERATRIVSAADRVAEQRTVGGLR